MDCILWRRLDSPGHEAARLLREGDGWVLSGTAAFAHEGEPCCLAYRVVCDAGWTTRSARVTGWIGRVAVECALEADAERRWRLDGREVPGVEGCVDVDLSFSPATNLLPIRRLVLRPGEAAAVRAAWLRFPALALQPLDQVYRRVSAGEYRYESAGGSFSAALEAAPSGFVTRYAGLWEAEAAS